MDIARVFRTVRRYRHMDGRMLAASVTGYGLLTVAEPALRTRIAPSLRQLDSAARGVGTAETFVEALLGTDIASRPRLEQAAHGFDEVSDLLAERYEVVRPAFPSRWAVGNQSALALYLVVRLTRPDVVVETGVASGHSSYLLLSALQANGHGRLVSFDVIPGAGALVPSSLRERWQLTILDNADPIGDAIAQASTINCADIFFHDADHSYIGQCADYAIAEAVLARGRLGLLLSDDVDASFAFIDFVTSRQPESAAVLIDVRKVLGGCSVPVESPRLIG